MPHTSTAKKRLRQGAKRRLRNRAAKKGIKVQIKKFLDAAEGTDLAALKKEYNQTAMKLDQAAAKRVIHPNLAARKKSQLARQINAKANPAPAAAAAK